MSLRSDERMVLTYLRMALGSILLALCFGAMAALHYFPDMSDRLTDIGLGLTRFRPLHTTFAHAWIFGACIATIYHYLHHAHGEFSSADVSRFRWSTGLFLLAGGLAIVTLMLGIGTGREYLGFHPSVSALFLGGWCLFAFTALRYLRRNFWSQPVYVYQWMIGILYFIYTFLEGHAHLVLESLSTMPIADLQIQWKSCGTLVGSFNFLVYGCLMYVGERVTGYKDYAQSKTCFALFAIGCANSFTNFAHHTYHLPQSHVVKWIAFLMSMAEILIVLRVLMDIVSAVAKKADPEHVATLRFMASAKWWTWIQVLIAVVISVPSLNSIVHGTHAVLGHAMGTELGIDSTVLFAAVSFLLVRLHPDCGRLHRRLNGIHTHGVTILFNTAVALLSGWLMFSGTVHGYHRYLGLSDPPWLTSLSWLFPASGALLAVALLGLLTRWVPYLFRIPARRVAMAPKQRTAS